MGGPSFLFRYGYDATGRRAWKDVDGTKTIFVYQGPNCIAEYEAGDSAVNVGNEYVYSMEIDSLVMIDNKSQVKKLNVLRNHQWCVVGLLDSTSGIIEELYGYNAFGERTNNSG